jgi:RNA polymerase sigma-70 factor (ECF subfamily)
VTAIDGSNGRCHPPEVDSTGPLVAGRANRTKTLGDVLYERATPASMSEQEWVDVVKSIAGGDQLALHSLYERTHRIVFTLMVRITNSRETAEELTLDVFHDVWRRASTYDPANGSVLGWIMNQARSRAIDRVRHEQRKKRVNDETKSPVVAGAAEDPQSAFHAREQSQVLRKALDDLNREERQAIEMAFFSELTYQEVAASLKEPLGTVKSRIRSGLTKLRNVLVRARSDV